MYVSQNLLFPSSACRLPCVRQRWGHTGDFILILVITEKSYEL